MFQVFFETLEARSCWFCQRLHCFVLRNRSFQITVRQFIILPPAVRTCNPLPKQKPFHKIPIQCCHNTVFPFPREDFNLIERAVINQNAWKV